MGNNLEQPSFKNKKNWVRLNGHLSVNPDDGKVMITAQEQPARDTLNLDPNNFFCTESPKNLGWLAGESSAIGGDFFRYFESGQAILGDDSDLGIEEYENKFAAEGEAIKRN